MSAGMTEFAVAMWSDVRPKEQCPSGPDWFSNHRQSNRGGAAQLLGLSLQRFTNRVANSGAQAAK